MPLTSTLRSLASLLFGATALLATGVVDAQQAVVPPTVAPGARMASRAELEAAAAHLDRLAASPAYSRSTRDRARDGAAHARRRLAEGDFRPGDRILVRVEGQRQLDDTVTVLEAGRISLRGIRDVTLSGVLRSELEPLVRREVTALILDARVSARPLMRVAVLGAVGRPGYLAVTSESTLDQLLTLSGGPSPNAGVDRATVMRADTLLLGAKEVVRAFAAGSTIEDLALADGDVLSVPSQSPPWDRTATLSIVTLFLAPLITIFAVR
jgi:protein involved in polysaccharide export with SLBB domain